MSKNPFIAPSHCLNKGCIMAPGQPYTIRGCVGGVSHRFASPRKADLVNAPPHYLAHPSGVECITITEHFNFNLGNAIKYVWRAGEKTESPLEDLEKAKWYLEREIKRLEGEKK